MSLETGYSAQSSGSSAQTPQQSAQSQQSSAGGESAEGGEGGQQIVEYLKGLEGKVGELGEKHKAAQTQAEKATSTLDKIREAFGDKEPDANPESEIDAFQSRILDMALQAEKAGTPITLTAQIGLALVEQMKQNQNLTKQIQAITDAQKNLSNPVLIHDQNAYANMDNEIEQNLVTMYGQADPHMFTAIGNKLGAALREMQAKHPQTWAEVRRNETKQRQLARYFVEQTIPPKAREILRNEKLQSEPMTTADLLQAMKEANEKIKDPAEKARLIAKIRQQLWANKYANKAL